MKNLLFTILIIIPLLGAAQKEIQLKEASVKKFAVGFVPQYAIMSGTRLDFDINLNKGNFWLVTAPQFYIDRNSTSVYSDYREMTGAGIDLQFRYYIDKRKSANGPYFAIGPVFQYFNIKKNGLETYNFTENNAQYVSLQDQLITTRNYKFGANIIAGAQVLAYNQFYMDFYIGTGFRLSYNNRESGLSNQNNDSWIDRGYSGTLLVGGIRFGLYFN